MRGSDSPPSPKSRLMNMNEAIIKMQGRSRMDAAGSERRGVHARPPRVRIPGPGAELGAWGRGWAGAAVFRLGQAWPPPPGSPPDRRFPEPRGPLMSWAQNFPLLSGPARPGLSHRRPRPAPPSVCAAPGPTDVNGGCGEG